MFSKLGNFKLVAGLAVACLFAGTAQAQLADSIAEFSGTQGQDNWYQGWYDFTTDGGDYSDADFTEFLNDGSGVRDAEYVAGSEVNHWNGTDYRLDAGEAPWTFLANENSHPNQQAATGEHWVIRRWVSEITGTIQVTGNLRAQNTGGTGTSIILFHNGTELDKLTNSTGTNQSLEQTFAVTAGDNIDLALSPEGNNGDRADGADGSFFSMVIVDAATLDPDEDGVLGSADNCPNDANADQADGDEDGIGDVCDPCDDNVDADEDGTGDACDNCPDDANADQADHDSDGQGDICDTSIIADSRADFSGEGIQGVNGWTNGLYNLTTDDDGIYQADNFAAFDEQLHWRAASSTWRLAPSGAPWVLLQEEGAHPNGDNSAPNEEMWAIRRWTSDRDGFVLVRGLARAQNTNGAGTKIALYHNGTFVDSAQLAGNDEGKVILRGLEVAVGDTIDLALTPENVDGVRHDGSDGTFTRLVIDEWEGPGVPMGSPVTYVLLGGILLVIGAGLLRRLQPQRAS